MTPEQVRDTAVAGLEEAKVQDIKVMDVRGLTDITDFMILATGTSSRHVNAIADKLVDYMKDHGHRPLGVEGQEEAEWVLVDLNDVITHIMQTDARVFYDLEKLWGEELRQIVEKSREG
ncbi:ribosomal silencing factor RsfS [bacterium BMS3Bbin11]|nr:ribosomal silencing factor RsfS [bacterium BMS3Abin11]GBE46046.1 ribosomal silencing factor RsfS [bacterium BMS3Bbin11]GMT41274.1 MAG: ribosomal silencing factor RsfS [bacterium]